MVKGGKDRSLTLAQTALAAAKAEVVEEHQARVITEKTLTEAQTALAAAKAEVEQEHQARVKAEQASVGSESALVIARETAGIGAGNTELPPAGQRVSFIVRLTVDERSQPRRTEIVDQSGKKVPLPALDMQWLAQRLVAFLPTSLSPSTFPEPTTPPVTPPAKFEVSIPETPRSVASLNLSDVRVFRGGSPGGMAVTLNSAEAFVVQAGFELQGPQAAALTVQASPYRIQVYAYDVTSGMSTLVTTHRANLVEEVLEYTAQMQVPGLLPGLYRLLTVVTLQGPNKILDHHDGPIVHVAGVEQPAPQLSFSHS